MTETRYVLLRPSRNDDIAFAVSGPLAGDRSLEAGMHSRQKLEAETYLDRLCDTARLARVVPPAPEGLDPDEQRKANVLAMLAHLDRQGAFADQDAYEAQAREYAHGVATALFYALDVEDGQCLVIDLQDGLVGVLEQKPW